MKFHLNASHERHFIRSYDDGGIIVGERRYITSLVVTPHHIITDWRPAMFSELTEDDFELVAGLGVEVVLLGTGGRLRFPPIELTAPLIRRSVGLEVMDTAAACRTYNILAGDGRHVAAALLLDGLTAAD